MKRLIICTFIISVLLLSCSKLYAAAPTEKELLGNLNSASESGKAEIFNQLSEFYAADDADKALYYARKALANGKKNNDAENIAAANYHMGCAYYGKRLLREASNCFLKALPIYDRLNQKEELADTTVMLALTNKHQAKFRKSFSYAEDSLKMYEALGDKAGMAQSHLVLANICLYWDSFEEGEKHSEKVLSLSSEAGEKSGMAWGEVLLGNCQLYKKNYAAADKRFNEALSLFKEIKYTDGCATVYFYMGNRHESMGNQKEALECFNKSIALYNECDDLNGVAWVYRKMGTSYYDQKQYEKAIECLNKSQSIAIPINCVEHIIPNYKTLSDIYLKKNDTTKAYEYLKKYSETKDLIFNEEVREQIAEMKMMYEAVQQEKEAKLEGIMSNYERNLRYFIALILVVGFIAIFIRLRDKRIIRLERERLEETSRILTDTEAQLLQAEKLAAFGKVADELITEMKPLLAAIENNLQMTGSYITDLPKDTSDEALPATDKLRSLNNRSLDLVKRLANTTTSLP